MERISALGKVRQLGQAYQTRLKEYVQPLVVQLDDLLDKRLVATFVGLLDSIIRLRHQKHGLLLTELGAKLLSPDKAPAGTKRISNLIRSENWQHQLLEEFLFQKAFTQLQDWLKEKKRVFALWDDSVIEKHETMQSKDLCSVRSSKAKRLTRIRPGYYQKCCEKTIHVAGLQWSGVLLTTLKDAPCLLSFRWWTTRGKHVTSQGIVHQQLLKQLVETLADSVVHVFDRGFGNSPWLTKLLHHQQRFLVRWRSSYKLLNAKGQIKKTYLHSVGKKALYERLMKDTKTGNQILVKLLFVSVRLPDLPDQPLTLLVCRQKRGRQPWYLLTNERVTTEQEAWDIVLAYQRRWQIEQAFRFNKSELALESPRLWLFENRLKLMMMVALVYAFLLSLLSLDSQQDLLRYGCHRTGKRYKDAFVPLYRTRVALGYLLEVNHLLQLLLQDLLVRQNSG
jgi:hypothetical protein